MASVALGARALGQTAARPRRWKRTGRRSGSIRRQPRLRMPSWGFSFTGDSTRSRLGAEHGRTWQGGLEQVVPRESIRRVVPERRGSGIRPRASTMWKRSVKSSITTGSPTHSTAIQRSRTRRRGPLSLTSLAGFPMPAASAFRLRRHSRQRLSTWPCHLTARASRFADADNGSALLLRSLDSFTTQKLPGTKAATRPFWSPDGAGWTFPWFYHQ